MSQTSERLSEVLLVLFVVRRGFVLQSATALIVITSLLVDLFTEESGRLTVIAKGARAKRSS